MIDKTRPTTRKVRFVSEHHSTHLMRADWETAAPASAESQAAIIAHAETAIPKVGAVVLSDYAKGALTARVIRAIIDAARQHGKPVMVDPKGHDYSVYRGATMITPNRQGARRRGASAAHDEAEIANAAAELAQMVESKAVLVTRSEEGMRLHLEGQAAIHIEAYPVKVRDVSGAGDTVTAVMAVLAAMQTPYEYAMRAANAAAAVVVGKRGTSTISLGELRHRICRRPRSRSRTRSCSTGRCSTSGLQEWRQARLAHRLHQRLLRSAASWPHQIAGGSAGRLRSPRRRIQQRRLDHAAQGPRRPINPAEGRAEVLAALEAVDLVVVFGEDKPLELIKRVRPAVLVKGADYRATGGRPGVVEEAGGYTLLVILMPGQSTTGLVRRTGWISHAEIPQRP